MTENRVRARISYVGLCPIGRYGDFQRMSGNSCRCDYSAGRGADDRDGVGIGIRHISPGAVGPLRPTSKRSTPRPALFAVTA